MRLVDADDFIEKLAIAPLVQEAMRKAFNHMPTVEVEPPRHGHWIVDEDGNIKCSECGHNGVGDNYCERCGAKMGA